MRTDFEPAPAAREDAGIGRAQTSFASTDPWMARCTSRMAGSEDARWTIALDQIHGALSRAMQLNADLRSHGITITYAEELIGNGNSLVKGMRNYTCCQVPGETRSGPARLGETLSLLRDSYRKILIREDLPPSVAKEVLAVAQLFDKTAGSMGIY